MFFRFAGDIVLDLPDEILKKMIRITSELGFREESGGILLGSKDIASKRYIVEDFTYPDPGDERSPWYFIRKKDPSNEAIREAWEESEGTINYLGEWHTHDEDMPTPSSTDKKLVREDVEDKSSLYDDVFMLIIGGGGGMFCGTAEMDGDGTFGDVNRVWWNKILEQPESC